MNSIYEGFDNNKDPNQRDYCSIVVFGDLGKGKSSWLSQFAKFYYNRTLGKSPRRVLICDPSSSRAFGPEFFKPITLAEIIYGEVVDRKVVKWNHGVRVLRDIDWNDDLWFKILTDHFNNGLLILDESRDFFKPSGISPIQKRLFTVHRNNCIDILLVSHNFMDLPLNIRKQFRIYVCFKTGDKPTNKAWFTQRTLPEGLYEISILLSRIQAPASKISPYVWYDAMTDDSILYINRDQYKQTHVIIQETPRIVVPFSQFRKKRLQIR
jgi:hypothetical protein